MAESQAPSMKQLAWLAGMNAVGTAFEAYGQLEAGRLSAIAGARERAAAEFAAWQADREAGFAAAIGQRQAMEERRQGDIAASRALAVAAAQGGSVSDPTIVKLMSNIKGEAYYRASVALWQGEEEARKLRLGAQAARVTGASKYVEGLRKQEGYDIAATGTLAKGASTLYARYAKGGPIDQADSSAKSGDEALLIG